MALLREVSMFEDFKVQLVKTDPDLCVFVTRDKIAATGKDDVWCFYDLMPEKKIKLVDDAADVKVQYVNSAAQAGWKNKLHKLVGKIGR